MYRERVIVTQYSILFWWWTQYQCFDSLILNFSLNAYNNTLHEWVISRDCQIFSNYKLWNNWYIFIFAFSLSFQPAGTKNFILKIAIISLEMDLLKWLNCLTNVSLYVSMAIKHIASQLLVSRTIPTCFNFEMANFEKADRPSIPILLLSEKFYAYLLSNIQVLAIWLWSNLLLLYYLMSIALY